MPHSLGSSDMLKKRITNFYTFRKPSVDVLFMKDKTNLDLTMCLAPLLFSGHGKQKLQTKNGALYKTSNGSISDLLMKTVYCIKQSMYDAVGDIFIISY